MEKSERFVANLVLSLFVAGSAFANDPEPGAADCHLKEPHLSKSFEGTMEELANEARAQGVSEAAIQKVLNSINRKFDVLRFDRNQQVFQIPFIESFNRRIDDAMINAAKRKLKKHDALFSHAEREYGVAKEVLATFWGLETSFGAFMGNTHTVSAIAQLAHDCRRPYLFRPQLVAIMKLTDLGNLNPRTAKGAWAGEIGQVQMLPGDILKYAIDGDRDGVVDLEKSFADAVYSAANLLKNHGWQANEPWIKEVKVEDERAWEYSGFDDSLSVDEWSALGVKSRSGDLGNGRLNASLVAPQGHRGPKFLVYDNFQIFLEWNQSLTYTLSAAHMAMMLKGDPKFNAGKPSAGLSTEQMKKLQTRLLRKGYDIGRIDGVLGAKTRRAVREEQDKMEMTTDGWPTTELLNRL